ncbi:MAG: hypothetical protein HY881_22715 [Deltaproteobacteria bacterium]|nr:hypothetical protein [Deltaproteobacteria bacterium]
MVFKTRKAILVLILSLFGLSLAGPVFSENDRSLLVAGPNTIEYSTRIVKPALDSRHNDDELSLFLKLSDILTNSEKGISINKLDPMDFFIYGMLDKIKLGFLYTLRFPPEKEQILRHWHEQFMQTNRADVFFAPSSEEIIGSRAAFGCTHYARAFIAVVKALGLVRNPEDLRYVISCKADDYNKAMETEDHKKTINGHQFVMIKMDSKWVAVNTSKGESTIMPEGFSPDVCVPPQNIPIEFESYPGVVFLIRKIGRDFNDDCGDDSLSALMNISRSGDSQRSDFLWNRFVYKN